MFNVEAFFSTLMRIIENRENVNIDFKIKRKGDM